MRELPLFSLLLHGITYMWVRIQGCRCSIIFYYMYWILTELTILFQYFRTFQDISGHFMAMHFFWWVEEDSLHMIRLLCQRNQTGQLEPVAITEELKNKISEDLYNYLLIFDKKAAIRISVKKLWDYKIELKESFQPKRAKVYPLSLVERKEVEELLKEYLDKGYVQESKSLQISLVFFVSKKDRTKRMVQDYCYLNIWTVHNAYPLSLISDLVD